MEKTDYPVNIDDLLDCLRAVWPEIDTFEFLDFTWKVKNRFKPVVTQVLRQVCARISVCGSCLPGANLYGTDRCPKMVPVLNAAASRRSRTLWFDMDYCVYAKAAQRESLFAKYVAESRLHPADAQTLTLDAFVIHGDKSVQERLKNALFACRSYVEDYPEYRARGMGIYTYSTPLGTVPGVGAGKSHLMVAVAIEIAKTHLVPFKYINFARFVNDYKQHLGTSGEGHFDAFSLLPEIMYFDGVLVLDDFGKEVGTQRVVEMAYSLVNTRYTERLPTLYTSNWSLSDLALERYQGVDGEAITDRISERSVLIDLSSVPSYRPLAKAKLLGA